MVKTTYLVDSENPGGLTFLCEKAPHIVQPEDELYVFLSQNSSHKCIAAMENLAVNNIKFQIVKPGSQSMDFNLVSMLGFSLARRPKRAYVIASNDRGYDTTVAMWETKGFQVTRMDAGSDVTVETMPMTLKSPDKVCNGIQSVAKLMSAHSITECSPRQMYKAYQSGNPQTYLHNTCGLTNQAITKIFKKLPKADRKVIREFCLKG